MTPVEKVAQVIRTHWCQLGAEGGYDVCRCRSIASDGVQIDRLEHYDSETLAWDRAAELNARAAIAALREPTDVMLIAAAQTSGMKAVDSLIVFAGIHGMTLDDRRIRPNSPLEEAWCAMIDAALSEDET